ERLTRGLRARASCFRLRASTDGAPGDRALGRGFDARLLAGHGGHVGRRGELLVRRVREARGPCADREGHARPPDEETHRPPRARAAPPPRRIRRASRRLRTANTPRCLSGTAEPRANRAPPAAELRRRALRPPPRARVCGRAPTRCARAARDGAS